MWLMTKYGFYSIVQKKPNEFHVRSREKADLENLVKYVPLSEAEVSSSLSADYAYRIVVGKEEVLAILNFLGNTLDYDNFKDMIHRTPNQTHKHNSYADIWSIMARDFGAYGQAGRVAKKKMNDEF